VWPWVALGRCLCCVQVYLAMTASCRSGKDLSGYVWVCWYWHLGFWCSSACCKDFVCCWVLCLVLRVWSFFWISFCHTCSSRIGVSSFGTWFDTFACWQRSCFVVGCMSYIESVISWWVDVTVFFGLLYLELVYYCWFVVYYLLDPVLIGC